MKKFTITKTEIGAGKWPFTVDEVVIEYRKKQQALFVISNGFLYGLNGFSLDIQERELSEIWLGNPDIFGTKKSISFIFKMCQNKGWL